MFGREARLPVDLTFPLPEQPPTSYTQYTRRLKDHLQASYDQVRKHMHLQQQRQKEVFDGKAGGANYKIGDLVWLHTPAAPHGHSRKLHRPRQGPFVVRKEISNVVYCIQRLVPPRQQLVVHFNRLKPYRGCTTKTSSHGTATSHNTLGNYALDSTSEDADYTLGTQSPTNGSRGTSSRRQRTPSQEGDTAEEPPMLAGVPGLQDSPSQPSLPRRSGRVSRRPDWCGVPIQFSYTDETNVNVISKCVDTLPWKGIWSYVTSWPYTIVTQHSSYLEPGNLLEV